MIENLKRSLAIFFWGEHGRVKYMTPTEKKIYYLEQDIAELEEKIDKDLKVCWKWFELISVLKQVSKDVKEIKHDKNVDL